MNDLFYHHLGAEVRDVVQDHATAIRDLMRQAVEPISEIGRRLIECKQVLGHGKWKKWLDREFQWSQDTAERFMSVVRITDQIPHGAEFDKSALYILANEKTPEEAVKEARERAAGGETITKAKAEEIVNRHKGTGKGKGGGTSSEPPKDRRQVDIDAAEKALGDAIKALNRLGGEGEEPLGYAEAAIAALLVANWAGALAYARAALETLLSLG